MKTITVIKLRKGFYLNIRYNGNAITNVYCKTIKDKNERIKEWREKGYEEERG